MTRREFSKKTKLQAFERAQGRCEDCTAKLTPGKYRYDHVLPLGLGGESTLDNCRVRCLNCDLPKTSADISQIAKAKRQQNKHAGIKTRPKGRPMPGTKASGWKHKMSGGWERRE